MIALNHPFRFLRFCFRLGGWAAAFLIAIGLLMANNGYDKTQNQKRLQSVGISTIATIEAKKLTAKISPNSTKGNWYFVDYRFNLKNSDNQMLMIHKEVPLSLYNQYAIGDQLPVVYLPQKPQVNALENIVLPTGI